MGRPPVPGQRARAALAVVLLLGGCIVAHRGVAVEEVPATRGDGERVSVPLRAHLEDGSIVVFPSGATLRADSIVGSGMRYSLTLADTTPVAGVPRDSIVGVESFRPELDAARSVYRSLVATAAVAGGVVVAKAIFGSCPTYYSDSAGVPVLEAEGFSYSIAPLLEVRDVDLLRARAGADGVVRLEVRNEALETHYINHLELLEVSHGPDETVLPDASGRPLAVRGVIAPPAMHDRSGRDLTDVLATADGRVYESPPAIVAAAEGGDFEDHVELALPRPSADTVALVLRLRNSLLNTALFYDLMLDAPGIRALDWMTRDLSRIDRAIELAGWYTSRFGMRVTVAAEREWRPVSRISDSGPIAWRDVALLVPVPPDDSLRIRLSFPADAWRIDRVAIATGVRHTQMRLLPLAAVHDARGGRLTDARERLSASDERYVETIAGDVFFASFAASPGDGPRTFLLASQGYYTEWLRRDWLDGTPGARPFAADDSSLRGLYAHWRVVRADLERRFYESKVPVR